MQISSYQTFVNEKEKLELEKRSASIALFVGNKDLEDASSRLRILPGLDTLDK
ncbi:unnamed protein product [Strongylus vulgaris]|uniref:Uncharacterized protein n=1 Tax=Strongylus vulgaris TaxID=40348 RepID=A0A3P7KMN4_STRVU|nr:unnamed protein product [Strongylus vulgaris]